MFENLQMAPPDAILGLGEAFNRDPNPNKINLSIGVYKDVHGKTPILDCVKEAERRLLELETQKNYLSIDGLPEYDAAVLRLIFGAEHEIVASQRAATLQTPGGTAALRVAADFAASILAVPQIWCSQPTWPNHPSVFKAAGLRVETYPYLDAAGTGLDMDGLLAALAKVPAGEVVCLHAGCHNPTGVDPTVEQWRRIAELVAERNILPVLDFAYQGFGDGVRQDAAGILEIVQRVPEVLICSSFSKNFGLYSERVGALTVTGASPDATQRALSHLKTVVRSNYSNPPKHGGAIVATVLNDDELRLQWEQEVAGMRTRINRVRLQFVETLKHKGVARDFSFIARQRGMFSYSGLNPVQVDELRNRFSIYVVGSGRINVAGMNEKNMDALCSAIASVL